VRASLLAPFSNPRRWRLRPTSLIVSPPDRKRGKPSYAETPYVTGEPIAAPDARCLASSPPSCGCPASARGGARARRSLVGAPQLPATPPSRAPHARRLRQPAGPCWTGLGSGVGRLGRPQQSLVQRRSSTVGRIRPKRPDLFKFHFSNYFWYSIMQKYSKKS
jgi:hypothetical protein